jgi:hypothetical protein
MYNSDHSSHEVTGNPGGYSRRGFLGLLGASAVGLLASTPTASAFSGLFPGRSISSEFASLNLPPEWQRLLGPQLPEYAVFLNRLRLKNITVRQILQPQLKTRRNVRSGIPPKAMWRNIRTTLKAADVLADQLKRPLVEVVSAYRSPLYNALCPGAKSNSFHLRNMALDLRYDCSARDVARKARDLRKAGVFVGGVGSYRNFTHIDTRGRNADW